MEYQIFGGNLPGVTLYLQPGESIYTQSGALSWMSDGVRMETNARGGLGKSLGRLFTGESFFMVTYTGSVPGDEITISSTFPGEILTLEVGGGQEYICQKSAFLCAEQGVELSVEFTRKLGGGLFGGEGFILQRLHGHGRSWVELDGSVRCVDLLPGQRLRVSTGNVAAFEASCRYDVETVQGLGNIFFGGEGLFLTVLEGPGKVWLQTMTLPRFAERLLPYIPLEK